MCSTAAGKGAELEAMAMTAQLGVRRLAWSLWAAVAGDSLLHSLLRWCLSQPGVALWPWLDK